METGGSILKMRHESCCKGSLKKYLVHYPKDEKIGMICESCFSDKEILRESTKIIEVKTGKEILFGL